MNEKRLDGAGGDTTVIRTLCIDGYKFIQATSRAFTGGGTSGVSVSLIQVYEPTNTAGRPAKCYGSHKTD